MQKDEKLLYIKETMENIAHQWRQPLSQINSAVSVIDKILYEKNIQEPELEERLQEIESLTKYMSNTIDDFKNHFANSAKKVEVKLATVIQNAIVTLETILEDNSIKISTDIDVDYECFCYDKQLEQIIIVLINNAKDALLDRNTFEARIGISLFQDEGYYIIKIADNAGGITKSVMEKMFEPYYTTKHHSQGSGIGLNMARKIIEERHFGLLNVKNIEDGSEFSIRLPVEKK